jgi:hypothetical protein
MQPVLPDLAKLCHLGDIFGVGRIFSEKYRPNDFGAIV